MTRASDTAEFLREFAKAEDRRGSNPFAVESLRNAADLIEELAKAIDRVREIHDPYDGPHTYCHDCAGLTPCETRAAIDAAMKGEG